MNNKYVWATEHLYQSVNEWNKDFQKVEKQLDFSEYKGKLGEANIFYQLQSKIEKVSRIIERLSVFAMMKHDENTKDSTFDSLNSKVQSLYAKFSASLSFVQPE